jgi:hypothetical protein
MKRATKLLLATILGSVMVVFSCCILVLLVPGPPVESGETTSVAELSVASEVPQPTAVIDQGPVTLAIEPTPLPAELEPTPSTTPAPSNTPVPTASQTSAPEPRVKISSSSANFRIGPGTEYERLDTLGNGTIVLVLATNYDQTWYEVELDDGRRGWLSISLTEPLGLDSLADIPTVTPTPTNTPTHTPTITYTPPPTPTATRTLVPTITPTRLPTATLAPAPAPTQPRTCCRICTTGKACGNSCINRSYTCRQPPGCACNASIDTPFDIAVERYETPVVYFTGDVSACEALQSSSEANKEQSISS